MKDNAEMMWSVFFLYNRQGVATRSFIVTVGVVQERDGNTRDEHLGKQKVKNRGGTDGDGGNANRRA